MVSGDIIPGDDKGIVFVANSVSWQSVGIASACSILCIEFHGLLVLNLYSTKGDDDEKGRGGYRIPCYWIYTQAI